jgi:diguanylate cyclase (GGDEF)-like protein
MRFTSLRSKLTVSLLLAGLLLVTVSVASLVLLRTLNGVASDIRSTWLPKVEHLAKMQGILDQHRLLATKTLALGEHRYLMALSQSVDATGSALRVAEERANLLVSTWQEKLLVVQFYDDWAVYEASFAPILEQLNAGNISLATNLYRSHAQLAFRQATDRFAQLATLSDRGSSEAVAHGEQVYRFAVTLTAGLIAITAGLVGWAVLWIKRRVSEPILRVSDAMHALAHGNLDVAIEPDKNRTDEVDTLYAAVGGYRNALIKSAQLTHMVDRDRQRFHAAVSNLPIGVAMFDESKNLIICNARYRELYSVPDELAKPGVPLRALLEQRISTGNFEGDRASYIDRLMKLVEEPEPSQRQVGLADGRIVNICQKPVRGVGWIATHEDVTERVRAAALVDHMARHDALTNLANRSCFVRQLEAELAGIATGAGASTAILYLDLDRFKYVNDTLGHPIGDALLQVIAERLRGSVRGTDFIARLGGDEFAIIQPNCPQPESARKLAERVIDVLSLPYSIHGHDIVIGVSVGVAMAPNDGATSDALLSCADMALYGAKEAGRGTLRFYNAEMGDFAQNRQQLESDLHIALATGQFDVHYQPIVDIDSGEITALEALVRWDHPERGLIAPSIFIPLAEQMGLIGAIGQWVLERACLDAVHWPRHIGVSVNVSPAQFTSARLIEIVRVALEAAGLPAHRLELEITENLLLTGREAALTVLQQLRMLGVRVAMDDFGCGYSSLTYLRSFPFDKIKIDKSFVRNIATDQTSLAIVRAVINLGEDLGARTTAEGIEERAQLDVLRSIGCNQAQGFLFSPAVPVSEVTSLLRRQFAFEAGPTLKAVSGM